MNDDMMLQYLMESGAMRPEDDRLKRKQQMIDMLREQAMQPQRGQMAGQVYVAPIGQAIGQIGQAYAAQQGQKGVDAGAQTQNDKQRMMIEMLRKKMQGGGMGMQPDMSGGGYGDY